MEKFRFFDKIRDESAFADKNGCAMGELLFGTMIAWVATGLYYEHKERARRNADEYREEQRDILRSISHEFGSHCWDITEAALEKHNKIVCRYSPSSMTAYEYDALYRVISNYNRTIKELEHEYISELNEKYVARVGKSRAGTLPESLVSEYKGNISDIRDTFRKIEQFMWEQRDITKGRDL